MFAEMLCPPGGLSPDAPPLAEFPQSFFNI